MRPSDRPRFSFLTTAYKTEAYLGATIDSVVAQSDADWELVVVDNGNDDDIAAIVANFAHDPRIKLVRQENRGYVGGVMAAAAEARGAYLCVLDSDDQLMPDFVRTMSAYLEAHPGVEAVGCDAYEFSDGEAETFGGTHLRAIGVRRVSRGGEVLTVKDVLRGRVPFYTGAISRESWDRVGGYRPDPAGGDSADFRSPEASDDYEPDVLLWLELSSQFKVRLIPERLARCRVRPMSLSRSPERIEQFEESLIGTFERFAESSGRADYQALVQAPVTRLRYNQAIRRSRWAFLDGDVSAARGHAREAFALRQTLRAAAVLAGLSLPLRLLNAAYAVKQRAAAWARRWGRRVRPDHS
jgi:glycosyltransferase involved in cell wall biosynthesis